MINKITLIAVFLALGIVVEAAPEKKKIIAVGDRAYPPLEFINEHGDPDGFNVDVFRAVAAQAGLEPDIRLCDWDRALDAVKHGTADLFIDFGYSKAREKDYLFCSPHNYLSTSIVSRKGSGMVNADALRGKAVILQNGEITHNQVKELRLTDRYINVPDAFSAFSLLLNGKCDAFVCNQLIASYYLNHLGDDKLEMHTLNVLPPITTAFAAGRSREGAALLQRLEEAENVIRENGVYMDIYKKWFVRKSAAGIPLSVLWYLGSGVALAGLVFFLLMHRKLVREKAREKDLLLSGIDIPLELLDIHGRFVSANQAFLDLLGIREIKRRKKCNDFMSCPLNCTRVLDGTCILTEVKEKRTAVKRTVEISGRIFQITANPIFDGNGNILYFVKAYSDITEQTEHIMHEKVMNYCLETFFLEPDVMTAVSRVGRSICEYMKASRIFIIRVDSENFTADSYFEHVSDDSAPLFNVRNKKFEPDDPWYRTLLHKKALWLDDATSPEALKTLGAWAKDFSRFKAKSLYVSPIFVAGKLWGNFGIIYDKSSLSPSDFQKSVLSHSAHLFGNLMERQASREKLLDALHLAQQADRAKSFFLATISHELRTPLNGVIGFTDLLKQGGISPADAATYLDSIDFSAHALLDLVNDVLDLSRLETGGMTLSPENMDFNALAQGAVRVFERDAVQKGLFLKYAPADIPPLNLDIRRIRQILFNLLGNAVKFTSHGGVELQAGFSAPDGVAGTLTFEVKDSGPGIPLEDRKKLTEPFVELTRMRGTNATNNGTGLGLAVVRKLLEAMGGELRIDSETGRGSTFTVVINHVPLTAAGEPPETQAFQQAPAQSRRLPSVLLVDDVEMNLHVLLAVCRKIGITTVEAATSGDAAFAALSQKPFDLVLTDLWMPEMNGEMLAAKIRGDHRLKSIAVAAVTADVEAAEHFNLELFDAVLSKPVTLQKIEALIAEHLPEPAGSGIAAD